MFRYVALSSVALLMACTSDGVAQSGRNAASGDPCYLDPSISPLDAPNASYNWTDVVARCSDAANSPGLNDISKRANATFHAGRAHLNAADGAASDKERQAHYQSAEDMLAKALFLSQDRLLEGKLDRARALRELRRYPEALELVGTLTGPAVMQASPMLALKAGLEQARIQERIGYRDLALIGYRDVTNAPAPQIQVDNRGRPRPGSPTADDLLRFATAQRDARADVVRLAADIGRDGLKPDATRDATQQAFKALIIARQVNPQSAQTQLDIARASLRLARTVRGGGGACAPDAFDQTLLSTARDEFVRAQAMTFEKPADRADAYRGSACASQALLGAGGLADRATNLEAAVRDFSSAVSVEATAARSAELAGAQSELAAVYLERSRAAGTTGVPDDVREQLAAAVQSYSSAIQDGTTPAQRRANARTYLRIADAQRLLRTADTGPDGAKAELASLAKATNSDGGWSVPKIRLGKFYFETAGVNSFEARQTFADVLDKNRTPDAEPEDLLTANLYLSRLSRDNATALAYIERASQMLPTLGRPYADAADIAEQGCVVRLARLTKSDLSNSPRMREASDRCSQSESGARSMLLQGMLVIAQARVQSPFEQRGTFGAAVNAFRLGQTMLVGRSEPELGARLAYGIAIANNCRGDADTWRSALKDISPAAINSARTFYSSAGLFVCKE